MNAQEFVKKFGWRSARKIVINSPIRATSYRASENNALGLGGLYGRIDNINGNIVSLNDLKRLVESWELVEQWGGLEDAKVAVKVSRHKKYLKIAIADVESCQ